MDSGKVIFNCPECGIRLSVNSAHAGVSGPCPHCQQTIRAPSHSQADAMEGPAFQGTEDAAVLPAMPPPENSDFPKLIEQPVAETLFPKLIHPGKGSPPESPSAGMPAAEPDDDRTSADESFTPGDADESPGEGNADVVAEVADPALSVAFYLQPWFWATAAVLLLVAWVVMDSMDPGEPTSPPEVVPARQERGGDSTQKARPAAGTAGVRRTRSHQPAAKVVRLPAIKIEAPIPVVSEEMPELEPVSFPGEQVATLPLRSPDLPGLVDGVVPEVIPAAAAEAIAEAVPDLAPARPIEILLASLDDSAYRDHDAAQLLAEFLAAGNLAERWPMLITEAAPAELAGSCLDRPMPGVRRVQMEFQDAKPEQGCVDHVHAVTMMDSDGSSTVHRVVVRQWLDGRPPKVLADPLLDLYGGRLRSFAGKPLDAEGEFDVVVSILATCSDSSLPRPGDKLTVKLMGRDHGAEIARAHVTKGRAVTDLLEDGSFRLSYGNPTPCRVRLRWNHEERPDQPWLELVEITRFGWGPGR